MYLRDRNKPIKWKTLMHLIVALGFVISSSAQLRVPFTSRASEENPNKNIYSVNGDFTMIGNTNLTLQNYNPTANNNNVLMRYVDVDDDSNTFNSSSADLTFSGENGASLSCNTILYAGLYWTGKSVPDQAGDSPETFTVEKTINGNLITKIFNKRTISLKGPNSNSYTQFTAAPSAIYYPNAADSFIYSAYAEVTDYVRSNGVGTYFAADIALNEGDGGGTGFSGGWGMIVIYENYKMKYRDITIYDGHAYVLSTNANGFTVPISGINTIQTGPVGIKLGLIASEGDVGITGDYFQIQKHSDNSFLSLNHSSNSTANFFNSSINTNNTNRNPNLQNNSGIDISMFSIPNANNTIIANNQTSTQFKYGTAGDTFAIFCMVLAVDAYKPLIEGILTTSSINDDPFVSEPYSIFPGQEAEFNIDIKNIGIEAVTNFKVEIPVPFNATYSANSAHGNVLFSPTPTPNSIYFDANKGANGTIVWDFGKLPLPLNPEVLLANLTFKLKATTNCEILANSNCENTILVTGQFDGIGATTGAIIKDYPVIQGYLPDEICGKKSISKPIAISINSTDYVAANCQNTSMLRHIVVCNTNTNPLISVEEIASYFPQGTLFYDAIPLTATSVSFSSSHLFPVATESTIYYALSPNNSNCFSSFTLSRCSLIAANNDFITSQSCLSNSSNSNLLENDTLNGNLVTANTVDFTILSGANPNITITTQGVATIAETIPVGHYVFTYKICNKLAPFNCAIANVSIDIKDTTPPIQPILEAVTQQCSVTVEAPATSDECNGLIVGSTTDPLTYTQPGSYTIHWVFTDASDNTVTAVQNIIVLIASSFEPVYSYIDCNDDNAIEKNVDLNALLPATIPSGGTWTDASQIGALEGSVFMPYGIPVGYYPFRYEVAQGNCVQSIEAMIEVDNDCLVAGECSFLVHNAFSPNNDDKNEVFYIENIEQTTCFPSNAVEIYNRWGILVYETKQYDNVARVFKGISEGRITIDTSEHLPTGTYIYSFISTSISTHLLEII